MAGARSGINLDRRLRLVVFGPSRIVNQRAVRGEVVHDAVHWAAKPSQELDFVLGEETIRLDAAETHIVRAFKLVRVEGQPARYPAPGGTFFLACDPEDRVLTVTGVNEIGRGRYLQLSVQLTQGDIDGTLTFADGYKPEE